MQVEKDLFIRIALTGAPTDRHSVIPGVGLYFGGAAEDRRAGAGGLGVAAVNPLRFRCVLAVGEAVDPVPARAVAVAEQREVVAVVVGIKVQRRNDLPDVADAVDGPGAVPGAVQRGQQHGGENGDDGYYDEQLDQSEIWLFPESVAVRDEMRFHSSSPSVLCGKFRMDARSTRIGGTSLRICPSRPASNSSVTAARWMPMASAGYFTVVSAGSMNCV